MRRRKNPLKQFHAEYEHIVGQRFAGFPPNEPVYFGQIRKEVRPYVWP